MSLLRFTGQYLDVRFGGGMMETLIDSVSISVRTRSCCSALIDSSIIAMCSLDNPSVLSVINLRRPRRVLSVAFSFSFLSP